LAALTKAQLYGQVVEVCLNASRTDVEGSGWLGPRKRTEDVGEWQGLWQPLLEMLVVYLTCSMSLLIEPEVHASAALVVGGPVAFRLDEG
jgi:hypothetical protein